MEHEVLLPYSAINCSFPEQIKINPISNHFNIISVVSQEVTSLETHITKKEIIYVLHKAIIHFNSINLFIMCCILALLKIDLCW